MRRLPVFFTLALAACPPPPMDSGDGGPPASCDGPSVCKAMGLDAVCRSGQCLTHVPCADDLECGLGELCQGKECGFAGCVSDSDCATGQCNATTFACAECGSDDDCPYDKPVCQMPARRCVQCADDSQCPEPGPAHCDGLVGACRNCTLDVHCPDGFKCQAGRCAGAKQGATCSETVPCGDGLTCVTLGTKLICLEACDVYNPQCPSGQICYTLKFTDTSSFVFDMGSLLGICYTPAANARNLGDSCTIDATGLSTCQPALACVPSGPGSSACRKYCDPANPSTCGSPDACHSFAGDFYGRQYGLCYADNGFGTPCATDLQCRANESCVPYDDPSAPQGLSPVCQFSIGPGPGLAPCGATHLIDGGTTNANKQCASGSCVGDLSPSTPPYFCYGGCATDSDCSIGARTGTCDQQYLFTSTGGSLGYVPGCRPGCLSDDTCAEYADAGPRVCRARVVSTPDTGGLKLNCGAPSGLKQSGDPCSFNGECRSGLCLQQDARGAQRQGYCVEPCQHGSDCTDAGSASGPLDCLPTMFLSYRGEDGRPATADDQLSSGKVCSGIPCVQDDDCSQDGGARCAVDVSALDAGLVVLRCRPLAFTFTGDGGACAADDQCVSGTCATLTDGSDAGQCFQACSLSGSPCPSGLTCRPGGVRVIATSGATVTLDGCAP